MRFAYIASAILAVASFALASPVSKREDSDVMSVLTTFQDATQVILPQIDSLSASGTATMDNVKPYVDFTPPVHASADYSSSRRLINELTVAANTASASLKALPPGTTTSEMGTEAMTLTKSIVTNIQTSLAKASAAIPGNPSIGILAAGGLADALGQVLTGVLTVLAGVVSLVGALLEDVVEILALLVADLLPV
ncbi:hypothetical protein EXIGLDRAFT_795720 [Exidia glandulosa HHB12029]|uniref:Hydrophobic surface binding protein n=1 Tax=Exidia glandulosa HHB12029 TaxID=1314781 RepID=A0A165FZH3_EXIGL|nr:hypothetical protein EXIGLDRAFT_795720 [Exidia glandulosa HHB12029]